jgi:hypothetical protein
MKNGTAFQTNVMVPYEDMKGRLSF